MRFTNNQRGMLMGAVGLGAVAVGLLQNSIDPLRRQPAIEPPKASRVILGVGTKGTILPFEYMLGAFSGFRQVIAGMLWVRTDSFFHSGNYDAILPLVRMITWLDPNWLDVYATGAWHLMYNFTDTDQRSDRRYLPAGMALLNEGIANNPETYEVYAEAGWNNYDKIKNYDESVRYYSGALEQKDVDFTRAQHILAHSYERAGRIDLALAEWEKVAANHKRIIDDPKESQDRKNRAGSGFATATQAIRLGKLRQAVRPKNANPPIDTDFEFKVTRVAPRKLKIEGGWNLIGSKKFDDGDPRQPQIDIAKAKGVVLDGPVDGARVDVRLHDAGYVMPTPKEFSFDVDNKLTIMQDALSTRGGKRIDKGSVYVQQGKYSTFVSKDQEEVGIYAYAGDDAKKDTEMNVASPKSVAIDKAIAGNLLSPQGVRQVEVLAKKPLAQVKSDPTTIADLVKKGYRVATAPYNRKGSFGREMDLSKDPGMYNFSAEKYDLILSVNPRVAPGFVQDRIGWSGEGLLAGKYVVTEPATNKISPPIRKIKTIITLSRQDIIGSGTEVLIDSRKRVGMNRLKKI